MKSAKEMRIITDEVLQLQLAARKIAAKNYVENIIMPRIEETAKAGRSTVCYSKVNSIDWENVEMYLHGFGYKIENRTNYFYIYW